MKRKLFRSMVLAVVAILIASAAYAQTVNVQAQIPFDFVLGDKVYPAGEYVVQTAVSDSYLLYVGNRNVEKSTLTFSHPITFSKPGKQTQLVFHRMGNSYYLYQVWAAGSRVGLEFRKSHTEIQMERNGTKSDTEIVAANIIH